MVDQHHAEQPLLAEGGEVCLEVIGLGLADLAGRHQRAGDHRRGNADDADGSAPPHEGERDMADRCVITAHEGLPGRLVVAGGAGDIGVMVARDRRYVVGGAEAVQPLQRRIDLGGKPDIDQVAGDGHMVG